MLKLLPAAQIPTHRAAHVTVFDQIKDDAYKMLDLLDSGTLPSAVALSHAQVSANPFNFFVVHRGYKHLFGGRRIIVNSKILDQSSIVPFEEGCLSFPGRKHLQTKRFLKTTVQWQYPDGIGRLRERPNTEHYEGLTSMIFQHEIDHSNGICIYAI